MGSSALRRLMIAATVTTRPMMPLTACAVDAVPSTPLAQATAFGDLPQVDGGEGDLAFTRFVLIVFESEEVDWLWIGPGDLRRARFFWNGSAWVGYWAAP